MSPLIVSPEVRALAAVAMDELVTWRWEHPSATELIDWWTFATEPATLAAHDQHGAAAAELHNSGIFNAAILDGRPAHAWMRLSVYSAALRWASGASETCDHTPATFAARPAFAAAARPGVVMCAECRWALLVGHEDDPCDKCGTPGAKGASTLWASHRGFALAFALCVECHRDQIAELLGVAS